MMDLQLARAYLRDRLPAKMGMTDEALNRALVRGLAKVWRRYPWKFTETSGQIRTTAVYDTGTITTLAALGTAVTFSGTALDDTFIGRHLRIGSDIRDYEITAVGSTTTCTIKDPYEGTAISGGSAAYEISKRLYRVPCDVKNVIAWKDTVNGEWLPLLARSNYEKSLTIPNSAGQVQYVVEAGYTTAAMYSTGTAALVAGNASVTITGGVVDDRILGQAFVAKGFPFWFKIASRSSTTVFTLEKPWPFDAQATSAFQISPAGTPLIELYPVHDYDKSIQIWYRRRTPQIIAGDAVAEFDGDYDDLWVDGTLNVMGLMDEQMFEKRVGDLASSEGLDDGGPYQLGAYGNSQVQGGPRVSDNSPAFSWGD